MLKDQTTQPTLFQEDSHANHSQLQENEEEKTMIVTSGMKLLELLPKQNQNGLLAKMLRGLLTSTTAWYSDRCKLIWKKKVSKSNVLLYQLQASVHGIREKEFGLLPTPTQDSASERTKEIQARGNTINSSSKDVSNSNSRLRRGRRTEQESRANEIWRFYTPKEEQTKQYIRSKAVRCDALLREETWWQTQSNIYGVPNGISYELDKNRSNRIKSLGNSIVPQIAYEIGKAIIDAEISQD